MLNEGKKNWTKYWFQLNKDCVLYRFKAHEVCVHGVCMVCVCLCVWCVRGVCQVCARCVCAWCVRCVCMVCAICDSCDSVMVWCTSLHQFAFSSPNPPGCPSSGVHPSPRV